MKEAATPGMSLNDIAEIRIQAFLKLSPAERKKQRRAGGGGAGVPPDTSSTQAPLDSEQKFTASYPCIHTSNFLSLL
jgi:hypothetical protein